MRIVFFGTPELGIPSLALLKARHELVAVVCQPDKEQGRGKKPAAPPVKRWALEHGIVVQQPEKLNDGRFEAWLREANPEICVLAAYGRLLKQPILDVPLRGFLNIHPSLLPKYRGPSPVQTAILNGDAVTGVTIMKVTLEMDAGPILLQEEMPIEADDTTLTLTERLAVRGAQLLIQGLEVIETGTALFVEQDHSKATYCKLFEKKDGLINWNESAQHLHNLVRAAIPWPVAFSFYEGEMWRFFKSEVRNIETNRSLLPGTIIDVEKNAFLVNTGSGILAITELQAQNKRRMPAAEFLRGRKITVGSRFQSS